MVKPLAENYNKLDPRLEQLSKYSTEVATAAYRLANALQDNRQIGTWGEIQLRRIIEMAGMADYCDFTGADHHGAGRRPSRPDRQTPGEPHSRHRREGLHQGLPRGPRGSQREGQFRSPGQARPGHEEPGRTTWPARSTARRSRVSLDFVILFVPGDQFLSAALSANPGPSRVRPHQAGRHRNPCVAGLPALGNRQRLAEVPHRGGGPDRPRNRGRDAQAPADLHGSLRRRRQTTGIRPPTPTTRRSSPSTPGSCPRPEDSPP